MPWTTKVDVTGLTPNQWDDAIHQADGVRSFRDGTPLQYPNWQVGQFYRGQGTPKLDVTGKEVNRRTNVEINRLGITVSVSDHGSYGDVLTWIR